MLTRVPVGVAGKDNDQASDVKDGAANVKDKADHVKDKDADEDKSADSHVKSALNSHHRNLRLSSSV